MLIARAFSGFPTWIKLYINSCDFLKNGPLCGLLTFDRSPNMVRRSACRNASFFLYRKDRLWCAAEFKNARLRAGIFKFNRAPQAVLPVQKKEALIQALLLTILELRSKVNDPQSGPFFKKLHEFI